MNIVEILNAIDIANRRANNPNIVIWEETAPQPLPLLTWFSLFLVKSSANFAKKIQELAEDKAENPRTCRGQSREENPYERLQENSNLQAFFFQTPFLIARVQTPKTLGGGTPPRGASIRRPSRVGVWNRSTRPPNLSSHPPSGFFFSEVLFPPPKSSPSSLGPTPSSAAICGAGASWRLLGRKNRLPRGLQELIKF